MSRNPRERSLSGPRIKHGVISSFCRDESLSNVVYEYLIQYMCVYVCKSTMHVSPDKSPAKTPRLTG